MRLLFVHNVVIFSFKEEGLRYAQMPPRNRNLQERNRRVCGKSWNAVVHSPLKTKKGSDITTRSQSKHFWKLESQLECYVICVNDVDDSDADDFDPAGLSSDQSEASSDQPILRVEKTPVTGCLS